MGAGAGGIRWGCRGGRRAGERGPALQDGNLVLDVSEVLDRPDPKPRLAVDAVAADGAEKARILRAVSIVTHDEVLVRRHHLAVRSVARVVVVVRPCLRQVRLLGRVAGGVGGAAAGPQTLA